MGNEAAAAGGAAMAVGAARVQRAPASFDMDKPQRRAGLLLLSPAVLAIILISVLPLLLAFYFSFTDYNMFNPPRWVGLRNYTSILGDPVFWEAIKNTLSFALSQVIIGLVVVIMVAALFNGQLFGGSLMRTLIYLPHAASFVVVALIWTLLLDPTVGPINQWIQGSGVSPVYFLSDPAWAMVSLVVVSLWRNLGYFMIIVLAALKSVPAELLEAAEIDGAGAFRRFVSISLPTIKGVVSFVGITWFLGALQMFTQSYVMTTGGPINATRTIVYLMYDDAFTNLDIGLASAMAIMLFVLVVIASLLLRFMFRTREAT